MSHQPQSANPPNALVGASPILCLQDPAVLGCTAVERAELRRVKIHLIAICGTGMGSFAGILQKAGHEVRGSDESVYPPMSDMLKTWNIPVMQGFRPENLDWSPDLVIIGNVIKKTNPEAQAVLARGLSYQSFPQSMGETFLEGRRSIVVAGTHGKTTTCAMTAWLLTSARRDPGFLIGGVLRNFTESFRDTKPGNPFVIEGDEYDTAFFDKGPKFLHYRPKVAVVTSIEHDHADIYANVEAVAVSFRKLVKIIPSEGALFVAKGAPGEQYLDELSALASCQVYRYGVGIDADWRADILREAPNGLTFSLRGPTQRYGEFFLPVPGRHNVANVTAALAVSLSEGCDVELLREGLTKFLGVKRRQEERFEVGGVLVVDDFAHHPTAVSETLRALKAKYQGRKLWAIFEPRSATCRRNILEPLYVSAFDQADEVVITYAHRSEEFPVEERFDSARLIRNIAARGTPAHYLATPDEIATFVGREAKPQDVVIIMSNGGFGGLHLKLQAQLKNRNP
jgi:UDP-N-acetylmuramate: L-alanyl-gamma-D-glutamyl-meso-diaminopimelate ligase